MLDTCQQACVYSNIHSHRLICAAPGSGKTTVMISLVEHLLQGGVLPQTILITTFTKKAGKELFQRLQKNTDTNVLSQLHIGTYHSLALKCLRENQLINSNVTILNDDNKLFKKFIAAHLKSLKMTVDTTKIINEIVKQWEQRFFVLTPEPTKPVYQLPVATINDIYLKWVEYKQANHLLQFDDLIVTWLQFLKTNTYGIRYFIGDEIQDANEVQHEITNVFASHGALINIVGDDCQSIYGFRGSNMKHVLNFTSTYKDANMFTLENNYRSTPEIVAASEAIISFNSKRIIKNVQSTRESGVKPIIYCIPNYEEEYEFIVERCQLALLNQIELGVLFRTNEAFMPLIKKLIMKSIPFSLLRGNIMRQEHVQSFMSFLRFLLLMHPPDHVMYDVFEFHKGIGSAKAAKLVSILQKRTPDVSLAHKFISTSTLQIDAHLHELQQMCRSNIVVIDAIQANSVENYSAYRDQILIQIIDYFLRQYIKKYGVDEQETITNDINLIKLMMSRSTTFQDFLDRVSIEEDAKHNNEQLIKIGTIHQSKGLEFENVIVPQCCSAFENRCRTLDEIEEQCRVLYVASSRAKDQLCFTYSKYGKYDTEQRNCLKITQFLKPLLTSNLFELYGGIEICLPMQIASSTDTHMVMSNFKTCYGDINVLNNLLSALTFHPLATSLKPCPLMSIPNNFSQLRPSCDTKMLFITFMISMFTNDDDVHVLLKRVTDQIFGDVHIYNILTGKKFDATVTTWPKVTWPKCIDSMKELVEQLLCGIKNINLMVTEREYEHNGIKCTPHVIIDATIISVKYDVVPTIDVNWVIELALQARIVQAHRRVTTIAIINLFTGQVFRASLEEMDRIRINIPQYMDHHPLMQLLRLNH